VLGRLPSGRRGGLERSAGPQRFKVGSGAPIAARGGCSRRMAQRAWRKQGLPDARFRTGVG
jgi:hypothetical protein